jgi:Rps23 Pro-64 3,4-dihydroxylase Tpa1-like proline 4-hydroxylase
MLMSRPINKDISLPYFQHFPQDILPQDVLEKILSLERTITPSLVYSRKKQKGVTSLKHRNSISLSNNAYIREISDKLQNTVERHWQEILSILQIKNFAKGTVEINCVIYGNNSYFKRHQDTFTSVRKKRRISWVYYFHKEPKPFSGGELIFYTGNEEVARVTPQAGMLIVFDSSMYHEVLAVHVKSDDFANGRFTITGFINQKLSLGMMLVNSIKIIYQNTPLIKGVKNKVRCALMHCKTIRNFVNNHKK